ncbi:anthranilate/para-aminobenzoate synthase component II [Corynebacterium mustelae]|uniref:anthranilate synthase n=1 Tax=Corynebacterium mustelae TaxID=571915 RepID=A0A0G3H674_9CORY|nr:anthranilate synthase component II [Corynebacterium mustelae]AKK07353.1 anthranilate/para-aminobenzoate synthase component II [Corynebacterium mustelae]
MSDASIHVVLIDNHDSFVYNLVDAFAVGGYRCTVFRNSVPVTEILAVEPDIICLSPGPGHPLDAGTMMQLIDATLGQIPILGICLGFQALLAHYGATVQPCGPVHGVTDAMQLTHAGRESKIFEQLTTDDRPEIGHIGKTVPVARYHSLGCRATDAPADIVVLGTCETTKLGAVIMAARTADGMAIGLQFHPESILSPNGPIILDRCIETLISTTTPK